MHSGDRVLDQAHIFGGVDEIDLIIPPGPIVGQLHALGMSDFDLVAELGFEPIKDADGLTRFVGISTEHCDVAIRSDNGNAGEGGTIKGQCIALILDQDGCLVRGFECDAASFGIPRQGIRLRAIGIRIIKDAAPLLHPQHTFHRGVDD